MFRCLNLLLLFYFVNYSGTAPVETNLISVTGNRGGSVILPCEFESRGISDIVLSSWSKNILVCDNEECKSDRVFKEGSCDVIIKDLIFSDAGKYFLSVYYSNDQREVEGLIRKYQLHIQDEISVKTGEELKMDVLMINADKVEHQTINSTEWTEVWTRGHGVSSDRLTDSDGKLTINEFTVTDTGTYRVLDSEGEILITVTVTGSSTGSTEKLDTDEGNEQYTVESWIIVVSVSGALVVLLVLLVLVVRVISALIWKHQHQHKNTEYESIPMKNTVQ